MDELVLINEFQNGDMAAFKIVFDALCPSLRQYARQKVYTMGIGNDDDADDYVAECFYKLLNARKTMRTTNHIKRWCFIVIKRQLIDKCRARIKADTYNDQTYYSDSGMEELLLRENSTSYILKRGIEQLPRQRKSVIKMLFFLQKDTKEIADVLGLSRQTVLNHKTKGIEELRRFLSPFKEYIII